MRHLQQLTFNLDKPGVGLLDVTRRSFGLLSRPFIAPSLLQELLVLLAEGTIVWAAGLVVAPLHGQCTCAIPSQMWQIVQTLNGSEKNCKLGKDL